MIMKKGEKKEHGYPVRKLLDLEDLGNSNDRGVSEADASKLR